MPINPLPVFEAEADPKKRGLSDEDIAAYDRLKPPDSVVVRYGYMRQIGEFPARIEIVPGCGTKFVVKTPRGLEVGEMLTTTCSNGGCGKSITRKQMLEYIENSGGKQYPFTTNGRVLRVATADDLNQMAALERQKRPVIKRVSEVARELRLDMKIVEVEPILGQEVLTIYYMAEDRVDFREMVRVLAKEYSTRIEMRQVGARDEARLTADYERCGQHCCCRQFLKVLKPVSMKSAKMQKATLDPLKISGRCGRLMCCLRYEDATYNDLKSRLPRRRSRVGTDEGPGIVIDTQILTQLVLVELDHDRTRIAVPVESLLDPDDCPKPGEKAKREQDALRGMSVEEVAERTDDRRRTKGRGRKSKSEQQDAYREKSKSEAAGDDASTGAAESTDSEGKPKRKRRRRRRRKGGGGGDAGGGAQPQGGDAGDPGSKSASAARSAGDDSGGGDMKPKRKRRRRRRKRGGGGGGGSGGGSGDGD
ncbi:MAG: stage 0 sporulation family protein [Phycisphaerales bacterium]